MRDEAEVDFNSVINLGQIIFVKISDQVSEKAGHDYSGGLGSRLTIIPPGPDH